MLRIERASERMSDAEPASEANSLEQACVMQSNPGVDKLMTLCPKRRFHTLPPHRMLLSYLRASVLKVTAI